METAKQSGTVNDAWFIESETEKSTIESVLAMADVEKIGLMGHSLGGAASVSVGRYRDDVDATVCIETVNEMVLEYMNYYLMGSGES